MLLLLKIIFTVLCLTYKKCLADEDYILNSPKCKIPDINPFNDDAVRIMRLQTFVPCNNSALLTFVKKIDTRTAVLHLRDDKLPPNVTCVYCYVIRSGTADFPDTGITFTNCNELKKATTLIHDIVKVTCKETETEKIIYENVHNPILIKDTIEEKLTKPSISVLLVVVDSISRLNFIRTMPQTYNFLKEKNFIEMKGYTKVADNTFPNFMALLTGFNSSQIYKRCHPQKIGSLDHCPMIWYNYRDNGYITAYAEDDTPITTFNFNKKGFTNLPTDYYFKPYFEATETLRIGYRNFMMYCTGPKTSGERVLNLAKDFSSTFRNHSSFGIFWMNTFSHNEINAPSTMDEKMTQFFMDLESEKVLDNTITIFLSDHGIRYGNIRLSTGGWFEERMPVNMISIPKTFQENFPNEYRNLRRNSHKLTSTYDMYMTLQHILSLTRFSYNVKPSTACRKCTSLFRKISTNRSCRDAGVPPEWCPCIGHFKKINDDHELVRNATAVILNKINKKTALDSECFRYYNYTEIMSASISEPLKHKSGSRYLFIVLKTENLIILLSTIKFKQIINDTSVTFITRIDNRDFC